MTSSIYSLVKDILCQKSLPARTETNSAKFGERSDRGGTGPIMISYSGIIERRHRYDVYRLPRFARARRINISILVNYSDVFNKFKRYWKIPISSYKSIKLEKGQIRKSLELWNNYQSIDIKESLSYLKLRIFTHDDLQRSVATMGWQKPGFLSA